MSVSNDKKYIILNNGNKMPILGVGTWRVSNNFCLITKFNNAYSLPKVSYFNVCFATKCCICRSDKTKLRKG